MNKKILVCDDDAGILEIMTILFNEKGYRVEGLSKSDRIFDKISEMKPDLILLDLWMSQLGGDVITQKLKRDKETKKIPVIIVSASKDTEKVAKRVHADGFLYKPFDISQLEEMISKFL